jgi:hypothetical protein
MRAPEPLLEAFGGTAARLPGAVDRGGATVRETGLRRRDQHCQQPRQVPGVVDVVLVCQAEVRRAHQFGAAVEVAAQTQGLDVVVQFETVAGDGARQIGRAIGRAVVDQQQREVLPGLRQQGLQQRPQVRSGVAAGNREGRRGFRHAA